MAKKPATPRERLPMPSGGGSSIRNPQTGELSPNPAEEPVSKPAEPQKES